jgi:hypothetical protein
MARASSSEKPFERTLRGVPNLIVTPWAGLLESFPFTTAQLDTVFSADKSLSLTVLGEGTFPVRGEGVVSR